LEETAKKISPSSVVLCGEPIEKVAACLLRSSILLCNDGGLMHLANALGVSTAAIFGPVDEAVYGPFWKIMLENNKWRIKASWQENDNANPIKDGKKNLQSNYGVLESKSQVQIVSS